ncbi:putative RNA helicase [Helianthus annuus]|uniref:RNA helicase n=1 Tax=Helianthus annuus TaxID=4232 RepID=A0A251T2A4_HELAN|nr:DEAD-box ATP-dependent RNA helicase 22 isoform X2 [Helianthus annuus]XP_035836470.1 DEAD-box ATP-dependent RNA helicase 22 isoform X2 [Helianthus annuus]KAF5778116.1 putative RNA helicase [Helianthus annuus]KAJ0862881.1 putative RNA helicase [Helianthus annuus]
MILQRSLPILTFCNPKFLLIPFNLSSPASFSPLISRFHHRSRARIRALSTAVAAAAEKETDTFFADQTVSWSSLGITDKLSRALTAIGLNRPSLIQAASIPSILVGNDVVVAAETGSGKTHGYLVPLFHNHLSTTTTSTNDSVDSISDEQVNQPHRISLVLCPNVMLCEQVVRMASCICDDNGEPLLRVAAVCGRQGWPVNKPNIIVSTPAALLNYLHAIDPERRRRAEFIRDVKHVVFDEADMLLCGSFQNQVIRLINMFRFDEKVLSRAKNASPEKSLDMESESSIPVDIENHQEMEDEDEIVDEADSGDSVEETEAIVMKKRDWRRTREIYERSKQYIFVAATLPENGKRTAGGELKRLFPDATWVSGLYLHRHNPRLEQKWIEVTVDTQVDVLIDAVNHKCETSVSSSDSGLSRTMVFANTVEAVEAIATVLRGAGIECYCYHSESSLEDRTRNLIDFQQKGGIFVCTDAAARGTDIPNVSHVIQAEFATSAVDFLHRVGRTARAGQIGLVTSMYNESNRDLVAAVRQAGKLCQPVEKAFSRKRSFRKKLKKRGGGKGEKLVEDRQLKREGERVRNKGTAIDC